MKRRALLFRYRIPLEAGVVLRDSRIKYREGLLVKIGEAGREGWGEIAPLPGFSHETPDAAQQEAAERLRRWVNCGHDTESALPSVAFGLSCARAELAGELPGGADWHSATLCSGDPDELLLRLGAQPAPVAKMKVGLYEPVRDAMMVNLLLEALPQLTLRLDANRSWSQEKARRFAGFIAPAQRARIAFIEEPCRTPAISSQFAAETGLALAWDESSREAGFHLAVTPQLRAVIIKPSLTGSLSSVRERITQAHQAGLSAVISSSLESSLGLTQLARLARWLTPAAMPGLDTLGLMQQQLIRRWPGSPLPLRTEESLEIVWRS
ncbi:o-succinylbenzoate synthase [Erwinia sp. P6884]|uniref:o-succinylbenzoate synthase n=1 Tax=Erwinia sp. P6884 TaxID=3141450 RepID=UPI00319ADE45